MSLEQALAPLGERLRPVWSVIRPAGWLALGGALVCYLIGRWLGWREFVVAGLVLALVVAIGVLFVIGRATYAVSLVVSRTRVRVGAAAFGGLRVANAANHSAMPAVFLMPVGSSTTAFAVPRLSAGQTFTEDFQIDTSRRAVVSLGPVRSSRGDGLGLLRREVAWTKAQELFIHPLTVSLQDSSAGFLRDLEGRPTDTLSSSDIAFHALRDYVVGDDLRHVHWKSSARVGQLLVRQFEETRRSHLVICLSQSRTDYLNEADFELAVSAAASLGEQTLREEKDLTVQVPARRLHVGSATQMLDDFTRLELANSPTPLEAVALNASVAAPDASVVVLVSGALINVGRFHRAAQHFGQDIALVGLRCQTGASPKRSVIANMPVLTIGDLADLPRVLRSLAV